MRIERVVLGSKMYDVKTEDEYILNPEICDIEQTAIKRGDGFLYPFRTKTDPRPGVYICGPLLIYNSPETDEDKTLYSDEDTINFDNLKSIQDMIERSAKLSDTENFALSRCDANDIYHSKKLEDDAPEMRGLKIAIDHKKTNLDNYAARLGGDNYANNKRLLNKSTITFGKAREICDALDMDAYLVIKDKPQNIANPMGVKIIVKITDLDNNNNMEVYDESERIDI